MNLRDIANAATQAINPNTTGDVWRSTGYSTAGDGTRTPSFARMMLGAQMQVQAATGRELEHLDSLNIQGIIRAVYVDGAIQGANRSMNTGGDILNFTDPAGVWWLVAHVLEPWSGSGWTKVACTMQNGKPVGIP